MNISLSPHRRGGSAVIVVITILAILLIYIAANLRSMSFLDREIKRGEHRQLHRLHTQVVATNSPLRL